MTLGFLGCCGIKEIQGLREWTEDRFFHLLNQSNGYISAAWVCFNGRDDGGYVQTFRNFILKEKLGTVVDLPKVVNPNSSNLLDIGMWQIDRPALRAWYVNRLNKQNQKCNCADCSWARQSHERYQEEQARLLSRLNATQNQVATLSSVPVP